MLPAFVGSSRHIGQFSCLAPRSHHPPALFMFAGCPKGEIGRQRVQRGIDGVVPLGAGNIKKMMTDVSED